MFSLFRQLRADLTTKPVSRVATKVPQLLHFTRNWPTAFSLYVGTLQIVRKKRANCTSLALAVQESVHNLQSAEATTSEEMFVSPAQSASST
jgi:hypothetical protein